MTDRSSTAAEIEGLGVSPLPDPPLDLGDWFVDPRGDWGRERPSPKVEGLAEVIVRLDDLPWEPGPTGVRLRRAIAQATFSSTYVSLAPETRLGPRQGGHHLVYVVDGSGSFAGEPCRRGTHIEVAAGASIEAFVAGPEGLELLELVDGDQGSAA